MKARDRIAGAPRTTLWKMRREIKATAALALSVMLAACGAGDEAAPASGAGADAGGEAGVVNVYSGRHYDSDIALFDAFTAETGVEVKVIEAGGDALIERIAQEGEASPADLFITADAGILWRAEQRGVFQAADNEALAARVPARFRHPQGMWFGLAKRARVVLYNSEAGLPEGLESYADLADPAYDGMICVRSSSNIYNQSLLASIIARQGEDAAEAWARGVVENFARRPQGNDTAQIEAVAAGACRLAIVNSYYVARFIDTDDEAKAAIGAKIAVLHPDQDGVGTHVNISGAGVAAHAPNPENAERLLAFLLRDDIQGAFAQGNNEYPIAPGVEAQGPIATLGVFREDDLAVTALGENQSAAVRIFDRVGWP